MKTINQIDFTDALFVLLNETFEGSPAGKGSVYLDRSIGVFDVFENTSAENASQSLSKNGTTIAAHCEHLRFYLEVLNNYLNGDFKIITWSDSWLTSAVDESEWNLLREKTETTYKTVNETLRKKDDWNVDMISVALGILAHSAYHLGAIRQIIKQLNRQQTHEGYEN